MAIINVSGLRDAPVNNVLDEALYVVQINKVESIISKQKQTPGLHLDMTVVEGPAQVSGASATGRKVFFTLWLASDGPGKAIGLQRLAKLCRVCDIPQDDDLDLDNFIGKTIVVKIKHRDYQGEPQEDVVDFRQLTV